MGLGFLCILWAVATALQVVEHDPEFVSQKTPELSGENVLWPDTVIMSPSEMDSMAKESVVDDATLFLALKERAVSFHFFFFFLFVKTVHDQSVLRIGALATTFSI